MTAPPPPIDPDALLCVLILAPRTLSRNRFHDLHEHPQTRRVRRRAKRVRGIIRQLLGRGREKAVVVGERIFDGDRVLLRFQIPTLAYERTSALSALEASIVHFVLARAGEEPPSPEHEARIEAALSRLGADLDWTKDSLIPPKPDL